MQTYEIAADEPMETLVRSLSRLARRDKDITLIVPAGANPFTPENVQKLSGVLRSYDARLRVQAADPAVVTMFQQAGFMAGPITAPAPVAAPAQPAPDQPPTPARPAPQDLPPDLAAMNFDYQDVGGPAPGPARGPLGANYGPSAAQKNSGFFQRLRGAVNPPAGEAGPPARSAAARNPLPLPAQPDWAAPPAGPGGGGPADFDQSVGDGPPGLDVTLPDWLRDAPPEPETPGSRVVGRVPASNLDVTMPPWLGDQGAEAPAPAAGGMRDLGLPDWLTDEGNVGGGLDAGSDLPDWLRTDTAAPPAPTAPPSRPAAPPTTASTFAPAPAPLPAQAPPAPAPAPPASPGPSSAPGWDMGSLSGSPQTAESVGQAVRAAGLDLRTRSLLLFGMALVRLAPGEAAGAAAMARQAGCSEDDLHLVVEMAQALGGGPSERLGRKILGT